uniref:NADH-ubiquinone oxidoreductase chain 5 n=1 Tax=Pyramidella dolabrata TaxID=252582 RepID=Q6VAP3_9GAST|nr:NADH dehydrogenase subunit 5 [Pyramidella dolabrata]AAR21556.2 NADH dehydrogenase subunit 5 [Pyramidella dolabrata]
MRFSFLLFCASIMCVLTYWCMAQGNLTFLFEFELLKLGSLPVGFTIIVDKISLAFSFVVTMISGCVFMFACEYMKEDKYFWRFIWILLSFVISMNLLIFSGSVFFLLLGWDGLGISSFALIIYYQSSESLSGGFQTLLANRVGDAIIVTSTMLLALYGQFTYLFMENFMWPLVFMLCVAAMTKSAQYPFSSWLPAAMAAPTPVSALVHSSTLVTAGIYLIIRLCYNLELSSSSKSLLVLAGAVTCLLGGWAATFENDLKKIIALSTLSQLGVMTFCLGMGFPVLALFHLFTHALFKALLFLAAGTILMSSFGTQDIRLLGSTSISMPLVVVIFNVTSLCLIGAPSLSAFYSKHLILELMLFHPMSVLSAFTMLVATAFTAKYVFRVMKAVSWSHPVMTNTAAVSLFKVDCSLFILSLGAISSGKFFSILEMSVNEVVLMPSFSGSLLNFVVVLGAVSGLILVAAEKTSYFLSTLFWLTPLFIGSSKILAKCNEKMASLDYGWLEPSMKVKLVGFQLSDLLNWPGSINSFTRVLILSIVISLAFSFVV